MLTEAQNNIANLLQVPVNPLGFARAVENASACVAAAARANPELSRVQEWSETFFQLAQILHEREKSYPELGALPVQTNNPSVNEILCQPLASVLAEPQAERVRAWFGIHLLVALATKNPLNRLLCHQFTVLLHAGKGSKGNKDDWYLLSEWMPLTGPELLEAKREIESPQIRKLIDVTLAATQSKALAPVTTAIHELLATSETKPDELRSEDDEDEPPPDEDAFTELSEALNPQEQQAADSGNKEEKPKADSLIGWRLADATRATYLHRFGISGLYDTLAPEDLALICKGLVHTFKNGTEEQKDMVVLSHLSLLTGLPPQLALNISLVPNFDIWYDIRAGELVWNYTRVLEHDSRERLAPLDEKRSNQIRIAIDADMANHLRGRWLNQPDEQCIAMLLTVDREVGARKSWLKSYRRLLMDHGDSVHKAYASRFARSFGKAAIHCTGSHVLAAFMALDFSSVPAGLMHYSRFPTTFFRNQQQRVLEHLGFNSPPYQQNLETDEYQGSSILISPEEMHRGWCELLSHANQARKKLRESERLDQIASAWCELTKARLLSIGCVTGHRLTRLKRLSFGALLSHNNYIIASDKVVDSYSAYRILPKTETLRNLLQAYCNDIAQLESTLQPIVGINEAGRLCAMHSRLPAFFDIKNQERNGQCNPTREVAKTENLDHLSQRIFGHDRNIGRHFLIQQLLHKGVSHWHITALTGHGHRGAEVFSDIMNCSPRVLLNELRVELELIFKQCHIQHTFEPIASHIADKLRDEALGRIPSGSQDRFTNPVLEGGRILPRAVDSYTLTSLHVVDQIREILIRADGNEHQDCPWLIHAMVFDGLHHLDVKELCALRPASIATIGKSACLIWTREGRANEISMPMTVPLLYALQRSTLKPILSFPGMVELGADWLKQKLPNLKWPKRSLDCIEALCAMAGRFQRIHVKPATLAASSRALMSSTANRESMVRLATLQNGEGQQIPDQILCAIQPTKSRLSLKARPAITALGTILFRFSDTEKPLGEGIKRARLIVKDARDVDCGNDLVACALREIIYKEAALHFERRNERRDWGSIASYFTEVAIALDTIAPWEVLSQWSEIDFIEFFRAARQAIARDARLKGKKGELEVAGVARFLRIGKMLGWEVPSLPLNGGNIYKPNGLRQSASEVLILEHDIKFAKAASQHAFEQWPVYAARAEVLVDMATEIPGRRAEFATTPSKNLTAGSKKLCLLTTGFSARKNENSKRTVNASTTLVEKIKAIQNDLDKHLFLEDGGDDWTIFNSIHDCVSNSLKISTDDPSLRFHATRSSAACRIVSPDWEAKARALLCIHADWQPGVNFANEDILKIVHAVQATGHGRANTFLTYYYPIWPLLKAEEMMATLHERVPAPGYCELVLDSPHAMRQARCQAKKRNQKFVEWNHLRRKLSSQLNFPELERRQPRLHVQVNDVSNDPGSRHAHICCAIGLLSGESLPVASNKHRLPLRVAQRIDAELGRIAPFKHDLWARLGKICGERSSRSDIRNMHSDIAQNLITHLGASKPDLVNELALVLNNDRDELTRQLTTKESLLNRLTRLSKSIPDALALFVRLGRSRAGELTDHDVRKLYPMVQFGNTCRDIGQQPLYQIGSREQIRNRRRVGQLTPLTRFIAVAVMAINNMETHEHEH